MGKARRIRKRMNKLISAQEKSEMIKEGIMQEKEKKSIEEELKSLGLPTEFVSSKGKQVIKHPEEAVRIGQTRKYQRVLRKKLKKWQIERIRGLKLKGRKKRLNLE